MAHAKIGQRFTVVLPADVRSGLAVDDSVEVVRRPDGVIEIRPQDPIEPDPHRAYWDTKWRELLPASAADYAAGRYRTHNSTEDFLAALEARGPSEQPPIMPNPDPPAE